MVPDVVVTLRDLRRRVPACPAPPLERAWDAWQAERYQRGEVSPTARLRR